MKTVKNLRVSKKVSKKVKGSKRPVQNSLNRDAINTKLVFDLLNNLPTTSFVERRNKICILLLFLTGCRINELRNFTLLKIYDLIQDGTITIHTYKTRTTRRIDISSDEQILLKENLDLIEEFYKELEPTNHVLSLNNGKELKNHSAYSMLNKLLKVYGDKYGVKILSHSFRIGYVTEILKYYNVNVAQALIGHTSLNTTIRYDRNVFNSDDVKEIRAKLNSRNRFWNK